MPNKLTKTKTEAVSYKIRFLTKKALIISAEIENRSQVNMLEVMILEYCKNHNIPYDNKQNKKEEK